MPGASQNRVVLVIVAAAVIAIAVPLGVGGYFGFKRYVERAEQAKRQAVELDTQIVPGSSYDATRDLVDEDFRFRLSWPGKGFKLLGEQEAKRITPDSVAGLMDDKGCLGIVIAESFPGADLAVVTQSLVDQMPLDPKHVRSLGPRSFFGLDGMHYLVEGRINGADARYENALVKRGDYLYQVQSMTIGSRAPGCFDTVVGAFSFLEGEATGRKLDATLHAQTRAGFRVRDRRLENASHKLAFDVPESVRLAVADDVAKYDADAAFVALDMHTTVAVGRSVLASGDASAFGAALVAAWEAGLAATPSSDAPSVALGDGRSIAIRRIPGPPGFETLAGHWVHEGDAYWVRAWHPASKSAEGAASVARMLTGVRCLERGEADRLAAELPRVDDFVGLHEHAVLRAGRYVDFEDAYTLRIPEGPWLTSTEVAAFGYERAAKLLLRRADLGFVAALMEDDATSGDSLLRAQIASLSRLDPTAIRFETIPGGPPGTELRRADVQLATGAVGRYQIETRSHRGKRLHLFVFGLAQNLERAASELAELSRGLELSPAPPAEVDWNPPTLTDRRFAFELGLPAGGWTMEAKTSELGPLSKSYSFGSTKGSVTVIAFHTPTQELEFLQGMIEQNVSRAGGPPAERSTTLIDGLQATRLVWPSSEAVLVRRGTILIAIVVEPKPLGVDAAEVYSKLRFLTQP
jgi:hypothetical protein